MESLCCMHIVNVLTKMRAPFLAGVNMCNHTVDIMEAVKYHVWTTFFPCNSFFFSKTSFYHLFLFLQLNFALCVLFLSSVAYFYNPRLCFLS